MNASPGAPYNRRKFIQLAGTAAAAIYLPSTARAATALSRVNVNSLSATSATMTTLKNGISAMRALPSSDSRSWSRVAQIHTKFCAHNNWFFLPWHRPYCGYLEWLIQNLTNTPSFRLPYWDWTANNKIPASFWVAPLNDTSRQVSPTSTVPSGYTDQTTMNGVMATTDFQTFGSSKGSDQWASVGAGRLEGTPHNCVHWWMGGDMNTYLSPLDPIFFMHHCNIDRLWAKWNQQHQNTTDPSWVNYQLQYGDFPNWAVSSTLSTQNMGYTYA